MFILFFHFKQITHPLTPKKSRKSREKNSVEDSKTQQSCFREEESASKTHRSAQEEERGEACLKNAVFKVLNVDFFRKEFHDERLQKYETF